MIRYEGPMPYKEEQFREKIWPDVLLKEECEKILRIN